MYAVFDQLATQLDHYVIAYTVNCTQKMVICYNFMLCGLP